MESQETLDVVQPNAGTTPAWQLPLQVVATTEACTRAALMEVRRLSRRLNVSRAVLLVPWLGSSTASVEGPANDAAIVDGYRQMADETGIDVAVRLCVCAGYSEAFRWMIPRGSTVVVGGRRRWWWPTVEQRIADRLKSAGHTVIFTDARENAGL